MRSNRSLNTETQRQVAGPPRGLVFWAAPTSGVQTTTHQPLKIHNNPLTSIRKTKCQKPTGSAPTVLSKMPISSPPTRGLQALHSPQQVVDFWHAARRLKPEDALHNSMRCVIAQDWAICGVVFLANSLAIGLRNTPCSSSQPALHPFAASYAEHPY